MSRAYGSIPFNFAVSISNAASPGSSAVIMAREQRILAIQGNRPAKFLDAVAVHHDPPVGKEKLDAVPVAGYVTELLAEPGLGRALDVLLLQPFGEAFDEGRRPHLPLGEAPLRRASTDIGFDVI